MENKENEEELLVEKNLRREIDRPFIMSFPFPYKLWIVVNLEFCDFLRWNRDGTIVLLDLVQLDDYLNSTRSIFKIKNRSDFLKHLEQFQFERLLTPVEDGEDLLLLQFKHECFQRHRLDMVAKIRRCTYKILGDSFDSENALSCTIASDPNACLKESQAKAAKRMPGDLCFTKMGSISKIQAKRVAFWTNLNFQTEVRLLQSKLSTTGDIVEQIIELPDDLFEDPYQSSYPFEAEEARPYAGYYGDCSNDDLATFFGDFVPSGDRSVTKKITRGVSVLKVPTAVEASLQDSNAVLYPDNSSQFVAPPAPGPSAAINDPIATTVATATATAAAVTATASPKNPCSMPSLMFTNAPSKTKKVSVSHPTILPPVVNPAIASGPCISMPDLSSNLEPIFNGMCDDFDDSEDKLVIVEDSSEFSMSTDNYNDSDDNNLIIANDLSMDNGMGGYGHFDMETPSTITSHDNTAGDVSYELTDNNSNASFGNFFTEYRNSFNILLEDNEQ